ncbi:MAG: MBL fold metallo-hydrolase [Acidiferrobacterales bacterium]|nr:MBL fold metallo-hydrolase [Acidiferrobacterales bacterium]
MNAKFIMIKICTVVSVFFLLACQQQDASETEETIVANEAAIESAAEASPAPQSGPEPTGPVYNLTQLDGDLYHATSDTHSALVLITSEGAILADTLNVGFAEWLKAELAERFNTTVKYVLYSHHHWDHASGGGVFTDTATLVGHENMIPALGLSMPANYAPADQNQDGAIQEDEATGGLARNFARMDADGDGGITGAELNRDIVPPTETYSGAEHSVTLGGKEVKMIYAGENHSNDGSIIFFPEQNTAFGVDWLAVGAFPRQLYGVGLDAWIEVTDLLVSLEPARIVPGHTSHGHIGNLDDAVAYAQMFRDLQAKVNEAIEYGVSKDEFLFHLTMQDYRAWVRYDVSLPVIAGQAYDLAIQ